MSNLCRKLEERALSHPDRVALSAMRGRRVDSLSFGELFDRVRGGAAFLRSMGLKKGDHVIFVHPVALPLYEALLACMSMGVVAVFVDVSAGRALFAHACERMKPKAIFFGGAAWMLRILSPSLRRIPTAIRSQSLPVGGRRWRTDLGHLELVEVEDSHPALVTFTSGSTGDPKAVVRIHGFLLARLSIFGRNESQDARG